MCVCLETNSIDEVCVAAVKAACSVGHLPSAACAASFEAGNHDAVSDSVVEILKNGQKCSGPGLVTTRAGMFCGKGINEKINSK